MNREQPPINDIELLSAFIDGELSDAERIELNNRLENEPALKAELESLQTTVDILHSLPMLKAPRDFRLDPAIYGRKSGRITSLSAWRVVSAVGVAAAVVLVAGSLLLGGTGEDADDGPAGSQIAIVPSVQSEDDGQDEIEAIIPPSETALQFAGDVTGEANNNIPAIEESEADSAFADDEGSDDDLGNESDQSAEEPVEQDTSVPDESPFPAGAPPAVSTSQPQQASEPMAEGYGGSEETTELPPEDSIGAADTFNGEAEIAGETGRSADNEGRDEQQTEVAQDAGPTSAIGRMDIDTLVSDLIQLVVTLTEWIFSNPLGR
ncbi:MAG: hypothetical protein L0154_07640 [Chloroflexi bacterium]|nr:hypothetical protein [Chloroflexota bacterium]